MKQCTRCGNKLNDDVKFCNECGMLVKQSGNEGNSNEEVQLNGQNNKRSFNKKIVAVVLVVSVVILIVVGYLFFFYSKNDNPEPEINITNISIDNYPEVSVNLKISNLKGDPNVDDFTIKEDNSFQKDLRLSQGIDTNEYIITYKTSEISSKKEINLIIAFESDDKEYTCENKYYSPEKKESQVSSSENDNTVISYEDESTIKDAIDSYENAFIKMVNYKNINYIMNSIDSSGPLRNEFYELIKSYTEQDITESLNSYDIESMNRINGKYEVTVYEKYSITYGGKKENKLVDFRIVYEITKVNGKFKVYNIKYVDKLGSR